jgi:hypothetical protein
MRRFGRRRAVKRYCAHAFLPSPARSRLWLVAEEPDGDTAPVARRGQGRRALAACSRRLAGARDPLRLIQPGIQRAEDTFVGRNAAGKERLEQRVAVDASG